ncbi:hypothetical protein F5X68DRAFT_266189 [Plectosphaerella plurivora]|uniref:Ankyrin n=1 Tax=Plectosphaerella plurivora TaxID=936078 RepID=A0A9P9A5W1_9PEZI|nr:hypothetical protein F5X68DRAFT_266189 [Plectosphaerella plurivora]
MTSTNSLTSLPTEVLLLIIEYIPDGDLPLFYAAVPGLSYQLVPLHLRSPEDSRQWWLKFASRKGYTEFARLLLDAGASPDRNFPVGSASAERSSRSSGGIFRELGSLSSRFRYRLRDPEDSDSDGLPHHEAARYTPLAFAIECGHVEVLRLFHDRGADFGNLPPNVHSYHHATNKYWAVLPTQRNLSPFYLVRHGQVYEYLRQIGLQPQFGRPRGQYPDDAYDFPTDIPRDLLRWMILREAEPSAIALAIKDGALNATIAETGTVPPLILACERGQVETAKLLVQAGESIKSGTSWAEHGGPKGARPQRCIRANVEGPGIEPGFNSAIWYAFSSLRHGPWSPDSTGNLLEFLDMFVKAGIDPNKDVLRSDSEAPLLHLAMLPHLDSMVVQKLIENGIDVRQKMEPLTFWNNVTTYQPEQAYTIALKVDSELTRVRVNTFRRPLTITPPNRPLTLVPRRPFTSISSGRPLTMDASRVIEEHTQSLQWKPQLTNSVPWGSPSKNTKECPSHEFATNMRQKIRFLVRGMIKNTATPIADTMRSYLSNYSTLCMAELDAALDLKQTKYKTELMSFQNRITMDPRENRYLVYLETSTLYNLRLWVEVFSHHQIDFAGPDLMAVDMIADLLCPFTPTGHSSPNNNWWGGREENSRSTSELVWQHSDVEDSFLEEWSTFIIKNNLDLGDMERWQDWYKFRDGEKMLDRMRDNLRWILKACFRMDIESGRGFRPGEGVHQIEELLKHKIVDMHADFKDELEGLHQNWQRQFQAVSVPLLMELPGWEMDWE